MKAIILATTLTILFTYAAPASAQRLIGLETGGGAGSALDLIDPAACSVPSSCGITPMLPGPTPPYGGVAVGGVSGRRWATDGALLTLTRPNCNEIQRFFIPVSSTPPTLDFWTGLAISETTGRLFYTTYGTVGEVNVPTLATGPAVDMTTSIAVPGPAPLAYPLTGVEFDPTDNTLWVIDSQFNVVHMDLPSAGGAVLGSFNVAAHCGGALLAWIEGIAIAPRKIVPGHPPGVLYISDYSNRLLMVDRNGVALGCCTLPLASPLAGLAKLPRRNGGGGGRVNGGDPDVPGSTTGG